MSYYTPEAARIHVESHRRWVANGFCPSVHTSKAWCNSRAYPTHRHWAPYEEPGGQQRLRLTWLTSEQDDCPCSLAAAEEGQ